MYTFDIVVQTTILVNDFPAVYVTVDAGHQAVIFDRFRGVQEDVVGEGTHFLIPWVQKPIIFDCRSRPRNVPVITGSKGTSTTADWMCALLNYFIIRSNPYCLVKSWYLINFVYDTKICFSQLLVYFKRCIFFFFMTSDQTVQNKIK